MHHMLTGGGVFVQNAVLWSDAFVLCFEPIICGVQNLCRQPRRFLISSSKVMFDVLMASISALQLLLLFPQRLIYLAKSLFSAFSILRGFLDGCLIFIFHLDCLDLVKQLVVLLSRGIYLLKLHRVVLCLYWLFLLFCAKVSICACVSYHMNL